MNTLLALPILIPLGGAALALVFYRFTSVQRALALAGSVALLAAGAALLSSVLRGGIQSVQMGGWQAPFGITLVADVFSAIMVLVTGIVAVAVVIYSFATIGASRESYFYYPLLLLLLTGVCGSFLTGDLFNLYVWFEVMLIASFVLLALGGEPDQMRGALKYVAINLVSSAFFLSSVGILYGLTGTLNMADLAVKIAASEHRGIMTTVAVLFLVTFGVKAAMFPLFFWLPDSYHTPPVAVSAVFAGLLTKVGVYALIRVFTLIFVDQPAFTHALILVLSALTMITGVLGAMAQGEFRRILSFHIISQIGYMTMGLGLFTVAGLAGAIFYIVHHIIVKTNLFLVSGVVCRVAGSFELARLGGVSTRAPVLALLFAIPAFSLAGIPPLSGFIAKFALVQASLSVEQFLVAAVALLVGLLTLYSMTKIWNGAFWGMSQRQPRPGAGRKSACICP
jgi:multicomponent Na+:H+ antiporter subunit D